MRESLADRSRALQPRREEGRSRTASTKVSYGSLAWRTEMGEQLKREAADQGLDNQEDHRREQGPRRHRLPEDMLGARQTYVGRRCVEPPAAARGESLEQRVVGFRTRQFGVDRRTDRVGERRKGERLGGGCFERDVVSARARRVEATVK